MTIRGVLLDVDGTLVDSNYLHAVCWAEAFSQHGILIATAAAHACIGMESPLLIKRLGGSDREEALTAIHKALYSQQFGHLRPLPGAPELLKALNSKGLRVGLASSAAQRELAALEQALDAQEWIDAATSAEETDAGKPAPDVLQQALSKIDLSPEDTVMIGDSVWDGEAAERAGIPFIAFTSGGTSEQALRGAGAVEVWEGPQDLLAHLNDSLLRT